MRRLIVIGLADPEARNWRAFVSEVETAARVHAVGPSETGGWARRGSLRNGTHSPATWRTPSPDTAVHRRALRAHHVRPPLGRRGSFCAASDDRVAPSDPPVRAVGAGRHGVFVLSAYDRLAAVRMPVAAATNSPRATAAPCSRSQLETAGSGGGPAVSVSLTMRRHTGSFSANENGVAATSRRPRAVSSPGSARRPAAAGATRGAPPRPPTGRRCRRCRARGWSPRSRARTVPVGRRA
jgi:hypothetical protein